jgi:hypothetical protein
MLHHIGNLLGFYSYTPSNLGSRMEQDHGRDTANPMLCRERRVGIDIELPYNETVSVRISQMPQGRNNPLARPTPRCKKIDEHVG